MRRDLKHRLDRIERALPKPPRPPVEDPLPGIMAELAEHGFVQTGSESKAEVISRALGITTVEFRALLTEQAENGDSVR